MNLMIGGILSGLTEVQLETLKEYAIAAGVAFQLQDDVLGMYGDSGKTGKSSDSDLRQGKGTLLISRVLEVGNGEQKRAVAAAWGNKEAGNRLVEEAKKALIESGAKEYSVEKAKKLAEKAGGVTEKMREMGMNEEAVDYLAGLTEYLVSREV